MGSACHLLQPNGFELETSGNDILRMNIRYCLFQV